MLTGVRRRHLIAAFGIVSFAVISSSRPALACSGPGLSLESVVSSSELIVEGTIEPVATSQPRRAR